jgi:hypothetical protein
MDTPEVTDMSIGIAEQEYDPGAEGDRCKRKAEMQGFYPAFSYPLGICRLVLFEKSLLH